MGRKLSFLQEGYLNIYHMFLLLFSYNINYVSLANALKITEVFVSMRITDLRAQSIVRIQYVSFLSKLV